MSGGIPAIRIRSANAAPLRAGRAYVLYWMTAARRSSWNFALDRAAEWCQRLGKPLLVLEALRCDYAHASDRIHRFVLDGMADNRDRFEGRRGVRYFPYVESRRGAGKGLLAALASRAAVVVTDDFPCFFLPRMRAAAARRLDVFLEEVDSNGLLPLRAADRTFASAYVFRRFVQRHLPDHFAHEPRRDPLRGLPSVAAPSVARSALRRWKPAVPERVDLAEFPIDHSVPPTSILGGASAAGSRLRSFLSRGLDRYERDRNHPDVEATSGLSPYLHFGHLSAHEVFARVARREEWSPDRIAAAGDGSREGWWGLSASAEAFLDQLVTWREIGLNFCAHAKRCAAYGTLPAWARRTLEKHARDRRPHRYGARALEAARTHDPLWNAAQRQLVREGGIHNALRMLWGKKILEWSSSPRAAWRALFRLNDKYALDGRDPNSASGIGWVLGRYDRPWGPERPIFGTIRYMSSASAARKWRVKEVLARYGEEEA